MWLSVKSKLVGAVVAAMLVATTVHAASVKPLISKRALREPINNEILQITQTVDASFNSKLVVKVGLVGYSRSSGTLNTEVGSLYAKESVTFNPLPGLRTYPGITAEAVKKAARAHILHFSNIWLPQLTTYMREKGIGQAWYTYQQTINIDGYLRVVYWNAYVGNYGDPATLNYGDPVISSTVPTVVHMAYVSSKASEGLPADWKFDGAGSLKYKVMSTNMDVIKDWEVLTPEAGLSGLNDEDAIKCLVSKTKLNTCPTGFMDMEQLLLKHQGIMGFIDFVKEVEPATEADDETTKVVLNIETRQLEHSKCMPLTYRVAGNYGMQLETTINRYTVTPSKDFTLIDIIKGDMISPTKTFDKKIQLPLAYKNVAGQYIINPEEGKSDLLHVSGVRLNRLAPLSVVEDTNKYISIMVYNDQHYACNSIWCGSRRHQLIPGKCKAHVVACELDSAGNNQVTVSYKAVDSNDQCSAVLDNMSVQGAFTPGVAQSITSVDGSVTHYDGGTGITIRPSVTAFPDVSEYVEYSRDTLDPDAIYAQAAASNSYRVGTTAYCPVGTTYKKEGEEWISYPECAFCGYNLTKSPPGCYNPRVCGFTCENMICSTGVSYSCDYSTLVAPYLNAVLPLTN